VISGTGRGNASSHIAFQSMLFYSVILIAVAFIAAVLGFVVLAGTAAFVLRMCFVGAFLLFVISLARREKNRL
jgi:uncharacterized membrane protein YtjA (UPF0391 family)